MNQSDLFGAPDAYGHFQSQAKAQQTEGQARRDRAIAQVAANAPAGWLEDGMLAIRSLALTRAEITSDDIWPLVEAVPEPRLMGALFREAMNRGYIRRTDRVRKSIRPECHCRPIAIWEVVR